MAPVLDPSWQNPYAPTSAERLANERAVRRFALRRRMPVAVIAAVAVVGLVVAVVVSPWFVVGAAVVALAEWLWLHRALGSDLRRAKSLGATMLATLPPAGDAVQRQRLVTVLDRLAATFGVDGVSAFIVHDPVYNAALVPDEDRYSLFVSDSLIQDFELIELEGVVAHCLARQRLGLVERESLAAVFAPGEEAARGLAGEGATYRADEVAAAAIRYPLGLAAALRRCARQNPDASSFAAGASYRRWRWVFFNQWADRSGSHLDDLDDAELRARALEEW